MPYKEIVSNCIHTIVINMPELLSCQYWRLLLVVVMLGDLTYCVLQFQVAGRYKLVHQQPSGVSGELVIDTVSTVTNYSMMIKHV